MLDFVVTLMCSLAAYCAAVAAWIALVRGVSVMIRMFCDRPYRVVGQDVVTCECVGGEDPCQLLQCAGRTADGMLSESPWELWIDVGGEG